MLYRPAERAPAPCISRLPGVGTVQGLKASLGYNVDLEMNLFLHRSAMLKRTPRTTLNNVRCPEGWLPWALTITMISVVTLLAFYPAQCVQANPGEISFEADITTGDSGAGAYGYNRLSTPGFGTWSVETTDGNPIGCNGDLDNILIVQYSSSLMYLGMPAGAAHADSLVDAMQVTHNFHGIYNIPNCDKR